METYTLEFISSIYLKLTVAFAFFQEIGRMIFELFADVVPKTCKSFREFCTGEYQRDGVPLGYKGAIFHCVIRLHDSGWRFRKCMYQEPAITFCTMYCLLCTQPYRWITC